VPIASVGFETYQFYSVTDLDGKAFSNTAGQPFASSIPFQKTLIKWEFEQLEPATLNLKDIGERNDTLNANTFKRCGKETLKLNVNSASLGFYYGVYCWRISYTLVYKPDGWMLKVANQGSYHLQGGKKVPFRTDPPNQQNTIGFLNLNGTKSDVPVFIEFRNYELDSFSFLRL